VFNATTIDIHLDIYVEIYPTIYIPPINVYVQRCIYHHTVEWLLLAKSLQHMDTAALDQEKRTDGRTL
jgi:hypothetical protein